MGVVRLPTPRPRTTGLAALAALVALGAAGCAAGDPATIGPTGVDGLVVPTPSPDPADFVDGVDNPWLPLAPGSRWRYAVRTAGESAAPPAVRTVTVTDEQRRVAGVAVTVVREVVRGPDGEPVERTERWLAQDTSGNVWSFGEDTTTPERRGPGADGSWEAGVDGAEAGLVMAAVPRVGDGYRQELLAGVAEDRSRVLRLDAEVAVPAGSYDGVLQTEETSPLEPDRVRVVSWVRGVGPVRTEVFGAGGEVTELVAHTPAL